MKLGLPLFATFWIGFVLVADGAVAYGTRTAARSADWTPTDGVVTRSQLKFGRKNSVSLDLAYTYTVDGQPYTGTQYQPGPHMLPSKKWRAVQAELPVGKAVTVYHDPDRPADALLDPGVKPDVLLVLLALTPFNVIAVGVGWACWGLFTGRREFDPARHVRPTADGSGYAARLNGFGPLAAFLMALLGVSFVSIFLVVLLLHSVAEVPTSWAVDGGIWAAILAVCGLFAWLCRTPRELVEGTDTLTVPTTSTGGETVEVPRAAVRGVWVATEERPAKRGNRKVFVPVIQTDDRELRFAEYTNPADAEALAEWVRERLNLGGG